MHFRILCCAKNYLCALWQYGLWSFQMGDTKLERFLPENQHTQRKLLNFEFWISGEEHIFCYWHLLITLLLTWCPIFDSSPLIPNSKFNNFLLVCWLFCKNLSNFVSPAWKLHNPYCRNTNVKWNQFNSEGAFVHFLTAFSRDNSSIFKLFYM